MLLHVVIYILGHYVHGFHFHCLAELSFESFFGNKHKDICRMGVFHKQQNIQN